MKHKTRLTINKIETLRPGDELWDAEVPGLHVRGLKTGRFYYLFYRTSAGRQRKPALGRHGVITLDQARRKARDMLTALAEGKDPSIEIISGKTDRTMGDLFERWKTDHASKLKSADRMIRQWELHILPVIGQHKVRDITKDDILSLLSDLEGHVCFNRVRSLLSLAFNLAEEWGWRDEYTNPVRRIKKKPEVKRRRYLRPDEVTRLGKVLHRWRGSNRMLKRSFAGLILLLMYTGARRSEIMTARWDYVDWHRSILDLPDSKTGAKEIILPEAALSLLKEMKRSASKDYIIPAKRGNKPLGHPADLWKILLEEADISNLRIHDLRHSFASTALSTANGTLQQVGDLLGHAHPSTTARYAHFMNTPKRMLADRTAATLNEWMGGAS